MTREKDIRIKAIEILQNHQEGVRFSQLTNELHQVLPDIQINTIRWSIWDLDKNEPDKVYKAGRGLFRHISFRTSEPIQPTQVVPTSIREEDFYKPFADFLRDELGECTKANALGGNRFVDRWATPDVIGIWSTTDLDPIKGKEIVSAEIKLDTSAGSLITAFGQACAYMLFSCCVA